MKLKIDVIDAFTSVVFKGNSAAVIVLNGHDDWLAVDLMQSIATENNLSETAFVLPQSKGCYAIRWFSPITEIDFCGHATLASSFVLFRDNPDLDQIEFVTLKVGALTVEQNDDGKIVMSFPNCMPNDIDATPSDLIDGLSIKPVKVLRSNQAYFAIYQNQQQVLDLVIDCDKLKLLAPFDVVATSASDQDEHFDFISRYFWPANGGDEDPVTGSIHAGLAPYWAKALQKNQLVALQASKRSGILYCTLNEDRVLVSGYGAAYLSGEIDV